MIDIEWAEPGPAGPKRLAQREAFVAALRSNPGRWARWPKKYKAGNSAAVTASRLSGLHPDIEWTSRAEDGHGCVYGRYNNTEESQ